MFSIAQALSRARVVYPETSKHHPVGTVWGRRSTDVLEPESESAAPEPSPAPLPTKKSFESGISRAINPFPLERIAMATSLSSSRLSFHTLLEDAAKSAKNSTAETLLTIAERRGEGAMASNGAFAALTGAHTGRSPPCPPPCRQHPSPRHPTSQ